MKSEGTVLMIFRLLLFLVDVTTCQDDDVSEIYLPFGQKDERVGVHGLRGYEKP